MRAGLKRMRHAVALGPPKAYGKSAGFALPALKLSSPRRNRVDCQMISSIKNISFRQGQHHQPAPAAPKEPPMPSADLCTEDEIVQLVYGFYDRTHLPKMVDF
jgi:hypothetical protein